MASSILQTAEEIVSEIHMSTHKGFWLVVEGASDEKFFASYELRNNPRILVANGWKNVVDVVHISLIDEVTTNICGVIDRDYRKELGIKIISQNIIQTDYHDLEIMLFYSDSLRKVIVEFASTAKLPTTLSGAYDINLIQSIISTTATRMAKFRYYCQRFLPKISFKDLDFSKFCCESTLEINPAKLTAYLSARSKTPVSIEEWDKSQIFLLPQQLNDERYLNHGHDVMNIFSLSLKKKWGTKNANEAKREIIERSFRLGYSKDEFLDTKMHQDLDTLLAD